MRYSIVIALALLAACASQAPLQQGSVANLAGSTPATGQVAAVPLNDPNSGRVCETQKRPGSLIAQTICYTRSEQVAKQAESKATIDELQREQHWRDQQIQEALMRNQYPRGAGLGPR